MSRADGRIGLFWLIQKKWTIKTKTMLMAVSGVDQGYSTVAHAQNAFFILLLAAWGCVGITQQSFGFHNVWEFWAYQAFYGIFVCPWYAVSVRLPVVPSPPIVAAHAAASDDLRGGPPRQRGEPAVTRSKAPR
jgi:hypothetical protein